MNTNAADPMTEIGNSLTYLGCIMSSGKLPDVSKEALEKFFQGEVYAFPDGSRIVFRGTRIRLLSVSSEANKRFLLKNVDLIRYIEFFINELAFVRALQSAPPTPVAAPDTEEQDTRQLIGAVRDLVLLAGEMAIAA